MGSTVTTGRMAAAFRAQSGTTLYCLYEETYEKNCHPHIPRWSAAYIGDAAGAVRQVFDYASMCEGGMLQNRSGRMTPEGYLRTWIAELQAPARMPDCRIDLYAKKDSYRAPLSAESIPDIAAVLAAHGLRDAATDLLAGKTVSLSLHEHGDLIRSLSNDHHIQAWSLLADYTRPSDTAERLPEFGIKPEKTPAAPLAFPDALAVSTHGDMILRDADGNWRCRGWPYEIIGRFVQQLGATKSGYPGDYCRQIRGFREHLKATPKADGAQLILRIDCRLATNEWERESIGKAAALPSALTDGDIVTVPFSAEHEYLLAHQPRAATTWQVLDEERLLKPTQPSLPQPA